MSRADWRAAAFGLRDRFDGPALGWPGVRRRYVFGWPAYAVPGRLFALFGDGEIVVKVADTLREQLLQYDGVSEWIPPGSGLRSFGRWISVRVAAFSDDELCRILEQAYVEAAESAGGLVASMDPPDDWDT